MGKIAESSPAGVWIEIIAIENNLGDKLSHLLRVMLIETIWKIILMSTNL